MAMLVVSTAIRPVLLCVEAAPLSAKISARHFPLQRTKLHKNRWKIASARADDHASEWRRESRELRVEIQELQGALADAWMQDEMQLLELEKLVSALADVLYARIPAEVGNVGGNVEQASSEARDRELSVSNFATGRYEDEACEIANLELEGIYFPDLLIMVIGVPYYRSLVSGFLEHDLAYCDLVGMCVGVGT